MVRVLSALRDDANGDADSTDKHSWQSPGEGSGDLPSEEVFAEWWPIVTGEPMIRATLTSFPLAWNGPGPMVPDFAPVENPAVLRQLMRAVIEGYEEADNLARSAGRRSSLRRIECQNTMVYQR
ncbi:MAG: hypothetical protein ACOCZB_05085 [Spirochaetota bacterium]